jgi:Na+-translocating ferredoxin:NAD+ oxidoreductase RnfC subunit
MPYLIHKYLYKDLLEEVERARVDLCIECGLCSFVCPSKIELLKQFVNAKERIESEKEEIRQEQILQEELLRQEKARRDAAKEQY